MHEAAPVTVIPGVGPKLAQALTKLNIFSIADLVLHLPRSYENLTCLTPIAKLAINENAVVEGSICHFAEMGKRRKFYVCIIDDGQRQLRLIFFKLQYWQKIQLKHLGIKLRCYGKVTLSQYGIEMVHPRYWVLNETTQLPQMLTPIYALTADVTQAQLQKIITKALGLIKQYDLFPENDLLPAHSNLTQKTFKEALFNLHAPPASAWLNLDEWVKGNRQRLAYEELFVYRWYLLQMKAELKNKYAPQLSYHEDLHCKLIHQFGFELTAAQQRVVKEIQKDLQRSQPMVRLLQGDVGSGKTCVAALAIVQALANDYQAALMVPTEILAKQHYANLCEWLRPLGYRSALLTSQLTRAQRDELCAATANGEINLIVGTHALFQRHVQFKALALVVVDEQHRFGVLQRLALLQKGENENTKPHQLIMTATPIPRSLAMILWSTIDCSVIDELPKNRLPITTVVLANERRVEVIERVAAHCAAGQRAYWVCPTIGESAFSENEYMHITKLYQELSGALSHLRIAKIHGQLKADEKQKTMSAFKRGEIDILIATTVIEVGVDVPEATLMIIEHAERFGLAQLHQLRGRVGRGAQQCYCVLLYQGPLGEIAKQRLQIIRDSNDGYLIAETDLNLRGPGDIRGIDQSGAVQFRCVNLAEDRQLLQDVSQFNLNDYINLAPRLAKPLTFWVNSDQTAFV